MKSFSIVVAMDENNGIGKNNALAWILPTDIKHFKTITSTTIDPQKKNAVIMGRKTWDSLPEKYKPLPNRVNVVLSNQTHLSFPAGVLSFSSLDEALVALEIRSDIENVFVIGGAQIYTHAIRHKSCHILYVTDIKGHFNCDAFFPTIPNTFQLTTASAWTEVPVPHRFCEYTQIN